MEQGSDAEAGEEMAGGLEEDKASEAGAAESTDEDVDYGALRKGARKAHRACGKGL